MTAKKRGRKPLNRASEDVRRPHSVRASDCEFKAIKDFLVLFRQDADKCYLFLQTPAAALPLPADTSSTSSAASTSAPVPQPVPDELTAEQQIAFDALMAGQNVFLSGGAGTGKTFILDRFIAACQKAGKALLRMAPTGIAARLIGGMTIHRAIKAKTTVIGPDDFNIEDYAHKLGQKQYEILAHTDVIVVDEISMCRSDLFAYLGKIILAEDQPHLPFRFNAQEDKPRTPKDLKPIRHHIQVVLCGDFAQLPPIIDKTNKSVWQKCYTENEGGWSFLTKQWDVLGLTTYDLKTVIRQSDPAFAEALNKIRRGDASGIDYINKNYAKKLQKNCMTICTKKTEVTHINCERYAALDHSDERTYLLQKEGEVTDDDKNNIDSKLKLCSGARIIFIANDTEVTPPRYSNGSFGTVTGTRVDSIIVQVDNGPEIEVKRKEWKVTRPELVEDKETGEKKVREVVVGKFNQIPVALGWAITIHKSQGQSYESVNIDPSNTFADGQLYVALSRCKNIHQMHLARPLVPSDVMTSKAVQCFYGWNEAEDQSADQSENQSEALSPEEDVTENE